MQRPPQRQPIPLAATGPVHQTWSFPTGLRAPSQLLPGGTGAPVAGRGPCQILLPGQEMFPVPPPSPSSSHGALRGPRGEGPYLATGRGRLPPAPVFSAAVCAALLCLHSCHIGEGHETFLLAKRPRGCREPRHLRHVSGVGEGCAEAGTGSVLGLAASAGDSAPGSWILRRGRQTPGSGAGSAWGLLASRSGLPGGVFQEGFGSQRGG